MLLARNAANSTTGEQPRSTHYRHEGVRPAIKVDCLAIKVDCRDADICSYMRRVFICAALLAIITGAPLLADTVMLHLHADISEDYAEHEDAMELILAVEDGIMFEMFEGGHIVFNTVDRSLRLDAEDAVVSGREEGVDWVMTIDLTIDRANGSFLLEQVTYKTVDVAGEAVYLEREVESDRLRKGSDESSGEAARRVGAEVGAGMLEEL